MKLSDSCAERGPASVPGRDKQLAHHALDSGYFGGRAPTRLR